MMLLLWFFVILFFFFQIDILDPVSNGILHALPGIISSSFQGYSPQDQEKMHNLLALWCDRQIFQQEQINYIGSTMINPP